MNKSIKNILITIWSILGIILFLWTLFWFVKVRILNEYGIVGNVIKLTMGYFSIIIYASATIIYWVIKRL